MATTSSRTKLAIEGGEPAVKQPAPPMFPGGMRVGGEEEAAVLEVLRAKRLFRYYGPEKGPSKVDELEAAFAAHMGATHAVAVSSGTSALIAALAGLGVGPGDEAIVPAYTWIASASAVVAAGAVPIIAEVDDSLTLDPTDVEAKITPATRAIVAVHMRGAPCDMAALKEIADRRGLKLLEDVAQADGASYQGRHLGSIGDAGAFSLQFNKIITAGEGGVIITSDESLYQRALMYHDVVGGSRNGIPAEAILPGINFRMTEIQGAIALVQLGKLDALLGDMRRQKATLKGRVADVAARRGVQFRRLHDPAGDAAVALIMLAPTVERAGWLADALQAEGVKAGVMYKPGRSDYHVYSYWAPILNKRTWSERGGPWRWHDGPVEYSSDMCPRTLDLLGRAVHLDVNPELSDEHVAQVGDGLEKVLAAF